MRIIVRTEYDVRRLIHRVTEVAPPVEVTVKNWKDTRSNEQNRRMWAMLGDVSMQVEWYGRKLSPTNWKYMFSASLKKQDVVPGIDGGFVVLGQSTSKMTIAEMTELIELMYAFGAEHNVTWSDPTDIINSEASYEQNEIPQQTL